MYIMITGIKLHATLNKLHYNVITINTVVMVVTPIKQRSNDTNYLYPSCLE